MRESSKIVEQIIIHRTQEVIRLYARACNMRNAVNQK